MLLNRALASLIVGLVFLASVPNAMAAKGRQDLKKVPVKIEIPKAALENLSATQREDLEAILPVLEKRLYTWANLEIELPHTIFGANDGQIVELSELFQKPTGNEEVARIGAERRRLSAEQLAQVRQEAIFTVPSEEFPGQHHAWRVSLLLQKGQENIKVTLAQDLADGLRHIIVSFPARIFGDTPISIRRGLTNFFHGLKEMGGLFLGVIEEKNAYDPEEIERIIEKRRAEFVRLTAPRQGSTAIDLALYDEKIMEKAVPVIARLEQRAAEEWEKVADDVKAEITAKERASGKTGAELEQSVVDLVQASRQVRFFSALVESPELEAVHPGLGLLLTKHGTALLYVQSKEQEFAAEIDAYNEGTYNDLRRVHPIKSRMKGWLEKRTKEEVEAYYKMRLWQFYESLPQGLRDAGLEDQAVLLERNISFLKGEEPTLRTKLEAEKAAAEEFTYKSRIWRKSRWKVVKDSDGHFHVERYATRTVRSDSPLWRVQKLWFRTTTWVNNGLYHLIVSNLFNGPVGLRSLFTRNPFHPNWTADYETGKIVPTGETRETLVSRVKNLWKQRREMLDAHARASSHSFLGKGFDRFILFWKADVLRGALAPLALAVGQPVATAANAGVTAAGATTLPLAWAPLTNLAYLGFNAVLFDTEGSLYPKAKLSRLFPIVTRLLVRGGEIGRYGRAQVKGSVLPGAGETLASVAALAYHPLMAVGEWTVGEARTLARQAWDYAIYNTLIEGRARVPGRDSITIKRVGGPGLSSEYFYQISPDTALVALWADVEQEELHRYENETRGRIQKPAADFQEALGAVTAITGGAVGADADGPALKTLTEDAAVDEKALRTALEPRKKIYQTLLDMPPAAENGRVKMGREQLENTLRMAAVKLEAHYTGVMREERWSDEDTRAFWKTKRLQPGEWVGLAKQHLGTVFGQQVLVPLEETDKTMRVAVDAPTLGDLARGLEKGVLPEHLEQVRVEDLGGGSAKPVEPRTGFVKGERLCETLLVNRKIARGLHWAK